MADDDLRADMFALADAGHAFALATIVAADGGPWPVGSQMVVTAQAAHGYLSDNCIDADVAAHARRVLVEGMPQHLVYGHGSPFIDMRLPCGGRIEVLVERVPSDDPALAALRRFTADRAAAWWRSDGDARACVPVGENPRPAVASRLFLPAQRLIVIGSDPFALAIAGQGVQLGWETRLVDPSGSAAPPPPIATVHERPAAALADAAPDGRTAIAVATHDADLDEDALIAALTSRAGYVGVLGARRRLPDRLARLRARGIDEAALARLHAPIGLALGASTPREVAVAVAAEIMAGARGERR